MNLEEKNVERYEYVRRLNPVQFAELWTENIKTGVQFDTLVDNAIALEKESSNKPDKTALKKDENHENLLADLNAVRESAREVHSVIGWARGQFGSLYVACTQNGDEDLAKLANEGYRQMNLVISNRVYRDQLWVPDDTTGDYKPRVD